jgi:hypothetical protein
MEQQQVLEMVAEMEATRRTNPEVEAYNPKMEQMWDHLLEERKAKLEADLAEEDTDLQKQSWTPIKRKCQQGWKSE